LTEGSGGVISTSIDNERLQANREKVLRTWDDKERQVHCFWGWFFEQAWMFAQELLEIVSHRREDLDVWEKPMGIERRDK